MKKVSEKRFRLETILGAIIFAINIPILINGFTAISEWYAKAAILVYGCIVLSFLGIVCRTFIDKKYFHRRFIMRNDERLREINSKSLRNLGLVGFSSMGGILGFTIEMASDGEKLIIEVPLVPVAVTGFIFFFVIYVGSYWYFVRKL